MNGWGTSLTSLPMWMQFIFTPTHVTRGLVPWHVRKLKSLLLDCGKPQLRDFQNTTVEKLTSLEWEKPSSFKRRWDWKGSAKWWVCYWGTGCAATAQGTGSWAHLVNLRLMQLCLLVPSARAVMKHIQSHQTYRQNWNCNSRWQSTHPTMLLWGPLPHATISIKEPMLSFKCLSLQGCLVRG